MSHTNKLPAFASIAVIGGIFFAAWDILQYMGIEVGSFSFGLGLELASLGIMITFCTFVLVMVGVALVDGVARTGS